MAYKIKVEFLEYGKRYVIDGAKEFEELAYSSNLKGESKNYWDWLGIPPKTRVTKRSGDISLALISNTGSYNSDFLFTQIHWRSENEFSANSPTNRNHEQIRFISLSREQINNALLLGYDLWIGLLFNKEKTGKSNRFHLEKYSEKDDSERQILEVELFNPDEKEYSKSYFPTPYLYQYIKGTLSISILNQILTIVDELAKSSFVQITGNYLDIEKKILLIEAIQRLSFPKMGILTFALDQVTDTTVRLQFVDKDSMSIKAGVGVIDVDKIKAHQNESSFGTLMLKIFTENYRGESITSWQEACGRLSDTSLKIAFTKGASPNDAYDIFRIINLDPKEFQKQTGRSSAETLPKLKKFIEEIAYEELQIKIIVGEGNFNLLEINNIDEFARYLKLILGQKNSDSIRSNELGFQHFLIKGEKLINGSIISTIKDCAFELLEICTDISCYYPQFAEWFVYNELVDLEDQDIIKDSLVRVSKSLSSVMPLEISDQFKRLLCFSDSNINLEQASKGNDVLLNVAVDLSLEKGLLSIDEVIFLIKFSDKFSKALSKAFFNTKIYLMIERELPTIYTKSWLSWSREVKQRYIYINETRDELFDLACRQIEQPELSESDMQLALYMLITEIPESVQLNDAEKYEMFSAYIEKCNKVDSKFDSYLFKDKSQLSDLLESDSLSLNNKKLLTMLIRYASENEYPVSKIILSTLINKYNEDDLDKWIVIIAEKSLNAFEGLSAGECLKCLNVTYKSDKYFSVLCAVTLMGDLDVRLFNNILWTEINRLSSWQAKQTIFNALKQRGQGRKDIPGLLMTRILPDYLAYSEGNDVLFMLAISNAGESKVTLQKISPSDIRYLFRIRDLSSNDDVKLKALELTKILSELTGADSLDLILEVLENMYKVEQGVIVEKRGRNLLIIPDELKKKLNYILITAIILMLSAGVIYLLRLLFNKLVEILSVFN